MSTQVLQEFYVIVTKKLDTPIEATKARNILQHHLIWQIEVITPKLIIDATEIQEKHLLSFWDAMIVTCAKNGLANKLVTEDLNHGQEIEGVVIENPFLF